MGNYLNKIENNKDYFDGEPMFTCLMDMKKIPTHAYEDVDRPLQTHMRMMYGRMNWHDYVMKLDEQTIRLLRDIYGGQKWLDKVEPLEPGMNVMILDCDDMAPASIGQFMRGGGIEVLTIDYAIERAAYWYSANLTGDFAGFHLTTVYFLAAFRLALMEGEMDDEARFAKSRLNKKWREVYASMLWLVSENLEAEATRIAKDSCWVKFELDDYEVEDYISCIDEED